MTDIRGYVLAGGQSSRMGSDKALLKIEGLTAIERQCQLLEPFCAQGVYIAGARSTELTNLSWPVIHDSTLNQGPLFGIISALQHAKIGIAVILAVDLLAIDRTDISSLLEPLTHDVDQKVDVSFAQHVQDLADPDPQPLCAAWRVENCLPRLRQQFDDQQRSVMKAWLELQRQGVSLPQSHLININSPRDMENFKDLKG
jgi:molybdopterin-guanine dinucleotide biosynthesis protein A